jgi:hypothetical protein
MFRRIHDYIETSDWDEIGDCAWKRLDYFCWAVMIFAALYFGGGYLRAWLDGRF